VRRKGDVAIRGERQKLAFLGNTEGSASWGTLYRDVFPKQRVSGFHALTCGREGMRGTSIISKGTKGKKEINKGQAKWDYAKRGSELVEMGREGYAQGAEGAAKTREVCDRRRVRLT